MSNYFYVGFEKDEKKNGFYRIGLEISDIVGEDASNEPKISDEVGFQNISLYLVISMWQFFDSINILMQLAPDFTRKISDKTIKRTIEVHGEKIDHEELNIYKMPVGTITEVTNKIKDISSIQIAFSRIPHMFLMGLVSTYDEFMARLLEAIMTRVPSIISSSEKNISFQDLIQVGSIEAMRQKLIAKEVDSLMRGSHIDHINWIEAKLGIKNLQTSECWKNCVEVFERRNLITHTGGRISEQYINICRQNGINTDNMSLGEFANINSKYFRSAVENLLEYGICLTQVVWRKIEPNNILSAAENLNSIAYDMMIKEKYSLSKAMLEFGLVKMNRFGSERIRKVMVINYAISLERTGNKAEANRILNSEDWSASTNDFIICKHAVLGEEEDAIELMETVVKQDIVRISDFRHWPAFDNLRKNRKFKEKFEEIFGEPLEIFNQKIERPALPLKGDASVEVHNDQNIS